MGQYLIFARSITYAQRMQRVLDGAGIRCGIFRAPREITDLGCAYVLRVADVDLQRALQEIRGARLGAIRIFREQNGVYQEVRNDLF